jgi:hypothetical protein
MERQLSGSVFTREIAEEVLLRKKTANENDKFYI